MSVVTQLAFSWALAAIGAVFLVLSARHNGRSGRQNTRADRSGIEDALDWLMEFRASLSADDDVVVPAAPTPLSYSDQQDATGVLRLDAALQRDRGMTPAAEEAPVPEVLA